MCVVICVSVYVVCVLCVCGIYLSLCVCGVCVYVVCIYVVPVCVCVCVVCVCVVCVYVCGVCMCVVLVMEFTALGILGKTCTTHGTTSLASILFK